MRFRHWRHPREATLERVYINGAQGLTGGDRAWWEKGQDGSPELRSPGLSEQQAQRLHRLIVTKLIEAGIWDEDHSRDFQALVGLESAQAQVFVEAEELSRDLVGANDGPVGQLSSINPAKIRVPEPVSVVLDHDSPDALHQFFESVPNVVTARQALEADMLVNDRVAVERWTNQADGGQTLADEVRSRGALFQRVKRHRVDADRRVVLVLEGDPFRDVSFTVRRHLSAALSYLVAAQDVGLLHTQDMAHTVYAVVKFATHERNRHEFEKGHRQGRPSGLLGQRRFVLEALPGVSQAVAEALLARFGSVAAIAQADRETLIQVNGIGPSKADRIMGILQGRQ